VFSEVRAPTWLHKYVIGRKGINVRKITEQYPKVCTQRSLKMSFKLKFLLILIVFVDSDT